MDFKELIRKGESKTLEFKEQFPTKNQIIKTIVAFSNTAGGRILIGVNDNRVIIGLGDEDIFELQDKIVSIIYDTCSPQICPEIYTENIDGKIILVIEVFRGSIKPYYINLEGEENGVYVRIGATNRKASKEIICELKRQNIGTTFDSEIDYNYQFKELDLSVLEEKFLAQKKELNIEKLKSLKLIKEEGNQILPTKALTIILGKEMHVITQCALFKGSTKDIFIDKKEFEGNLFFQLDSIEKFIKNHLFLRGEITNWQLQRVDTFEIPIKAIREAIVNAIVHRDYSNEGRNLKIAIYDDRLEVISPGGLPYALTIEEALAGRSEVRNKVIARIFKELDYVEQWGTGLGKIKKICIEHGLREPLIKETGDFFDIVFYRNKESELDNPTTKREIVADSGGIVADSGGIVADSGGIVADSFFIILSELKLKKKITTQEVMILLNLKSSRVRKILSEMLKEKLILRKGSGKNTYYIIANEDIIK